MKYRVLAATCLTLVASPVLAQQPLMEQPGHWAQDYTRRKADPLVRFGTLPNGMRYAIMHNETPKDGVSMRMRIGSGSLEERDDEQGLAHFLEHMAFRGSKNVPDGEVVHMLERQGLSFGADTNAFTAQDETVYMFNFPRADATALDTGLTLFREIGGRLNLAQSAIDAEKGVVLSEERLRDTPTYHMIKAEYGTLLDGTRVIERWPIGKVDDIKSADHAKLERFYQANYRPDNATIVIVGNIDPAAVEKQIIERFSDWKASAAPDVIDLGTPTGRNKTGEIVAEGVPDAVAVNWVGPADRRAETLALDREFLRKTVAIAVLNQRLADRALQPGAPFVTAQAGEQRSVLHSGAVTSISVSAPADKWQAALDAVSAEQRMLLRDGVRPAELKRAIETLRTALRTQAATASTRQSSALADAIVKSANDDELYTSPAQDLALYGPLLDKMTASEVNGAMKSLFAEHGPILFRSAQKDPATNTQLAEALTTAYSGKLGVEAKQAAITWPYISFGKPSAIVSRKVDPKIGTTTVKFANGTRLLVKPTNYEKDQIDVAVSFADGRAGVQPSLTHSLWEAGFFTLGGTKKLSLADITRWAQERGKVESVALGAGDRSFSLTGKTRPADLLSQMELLDAYARDPGFRPEAYEKAKALAPTLASQFAASPGTVYARGAGALLVGNDPRFIQVPSDADLGSVAPQDLPALLKQPLAGQADVVIVGDVTVDQAIKATEATFAAGAATKPAPDPEPEVTMTQPRSAPYIFEHGGRADQAFYGEYFQLPDYFADPKTSDVGDVAAAILSARLVDTVREKLGITYSPSVQAASSLDLKGEGYFGVTLETPPANFDKFHSLLAEQISDMASKPVSADELERAKQPLIEAQKKRLETNAYWLGKLAQMTRDPRIEGQVLSEADNLSAVSAADVQAMMAKYIAGHQPLTIISRAKGQ
jgi:zinc protease